MAANMNVTILAGNLTRDPELRYLPSGQPVCSFSIAVNRVYESEGQKKEQVGFFRIVVWGKMGEACNEYLKKGSSVLVKGRLDSRSWEAQDGTKRNTVEVVAENVQFLGGKKEGGASAPRETKATASVGGISADELKPDEDVPF